MLLPSRCPVCGALGPAPCAECRARLVAAPVAPPPPGLASCAAVLSYEGVGRELVARLKYRNERSALRTLAAAMASRVDPAQVDVVTWVPTTPGRRRARGYDQAELLARQVARLLGRPCRQLLRRRPGPAQTGRHRSERLVGPHLEPRRRVRGRVLVVDDVVTTGGSLTAAAGALRAAGAGQVHAVVVARTPHPRAAQATTESGRSRG